YHRAHGAATNPARKARDENAAVTGQRELREDVIRPAAGVLRVEPAELEVEVDDLLDVEEVERTRLLGHAGDARADRSFLGADVVPQHVDRPERGRQLGRRDPHEGRLAGAVPSDEAVDPPRRDLEGKVVERELSRPRLRIRLTEVDGRDRGRHRPSRNSGRTLSEQLS